MVSPHLLSPFVFRIAPVESATGFGANTALATPLFYYLGTVITWIDGDTNDVLVDGGFKIYTKQRFRLLASTGGVDTYELHDKDPAKRLLAQQGKARSIELAPPGSIVAVRSVKAPKTDSFGRWLAEIVTTNGQSVGDVLLAEGLAVPWVD
jgi:endonuclease YncB( thermonuclease family)